MSRKRNTYSPQFKAKVALAALKDDAHCRTRCSVRGSPHHDQQLETSVDRQCPGGIRQGPKTPKTNDAKVDDLYRQIGQLKVENDFLSKKLSL
jgi:transposase